MNKLLLTIGSILIAATIQAQSIYSYSVTSIEGANKPLSVYLGKKLLIITLPTQQNASNDSLLHSLDSLKTANGDSLVIIAAPSYEDGFTSANKTALTQWYRSILNTSIIITDGLYSRKTSGSQQHPLFNWLTNHTKNGHFDEDVTGVRYKFLIWKDGELIAAMGAPTKLGGAVMRELLQ